MSTLGRRPLTVGAGVIKGMEVLLSENISDRMDVVSTETVEDVRAKEEAEELPLVEFVTAMAIFSKTATLDPGEATVEFADVLRKQLEAAALEPE